MLRIFLHSVTQYAYLLMHCHPMCMHMHLLTLGTHCHLSLSKQLSYTIIHRRKHILAKPGGKNRMYSHNSSKLIDKE